MNDLQKELDRFMNQAHLRTVTDIIYCPADNAVVVCRNQGFKSFALDISIYDNAADVVSSLRRMASIY